MYQPPELEIIRGQDRWKISNNEHSKIMKERDRCWLAQRSVHYSERFSSVYLSSCVAVQSMAPSVGFGRCLKSRSLSFLLLHIQQYTSTSSFNSSIQIYRFYVENFFLVFPALLSFTWLSENLLGLILIYHIAVILCGLRIASSRNMQLWTVRNSDDTKR